MSKQALNPQNIITVSSISRPKRVVFFVHSSEITNDEIDEIILYSTGIWGGRFHAIIPTDGINIKPDWWKLLVTIDPDVIYSFVQLDDVLIRRINKYILPAEIIEVPSNSETSAKHVNDFDIGALGIEDIPRSWSKRLPFPFKEPYFFNIKNSRSDGSNKRFLMHNFGILPGVISTDNAFRDLPHEDILADSITPISILEKLLSHVGSIVTPLDICQFYSSRNYRFDFDPFLQGFHLVIGDNPLDRIYAWNRTLLSGSEIGKNVFWLSEEQVRDDNLLKKVCEWINKTYWSQHKEGKLISYSVNQDVLNALAEKASGFARFYFKAVRLEVDSFPVPKAYPNILFREHPLFGGHIYANTEQVPLSENKGLVGISRPAFLFDGHPQFGWMLDFAIQHRPEQYGYTNVRPNWELPKSLGIANQFFQYRTSRIINGGLPSTAVTSNEKAIEITIPPDFNLIWTYLNKDRYTNIRSNRPSQIPRFQDIRISDKGQYLQGMLRLFGNIYSAGRVFEDPFWRDIFLWMAGRPAPEDENMRRRKISLSVLKKSFEDDPMPIEANSSHLEIIAENLAKRLLFRDIKAISLTLKHLKSHFGEMRGKALKGPNKDWWIAYDKFDNFKEYELKDFLESNVLLQGVNLSCPTCNTNQFYVVDDLASEVRCNGCLYKFHLKPSPEWSFKLNDLVINALQKHGTIAVLQTLYYLQHDAFSGMFLFLPCLDIYEKGNNMPFTDLDIVVISKGKFYIGEVKSDPTGFTEKDFTKLKEVAEELLPDEVILAAPGEQWPKEVLSKIEKLSEALKPSYVNVSSRLLRWS